MLHQSQAESELQAAKTHIVRRGVYRFSLRAGNSLMDMGPLAEPAGEERGHSVRVINHKETPGLGDANQHALDAGQRRCLPERASRLARLRYCLRASR